MRAMEYTPCVQECECVELDDLMQVTMVSGLDFASTRLTHGCPLHGLLAEIQSRQKRLTDTECAAEYWRAEHHYLRFDDGDPGQCKAVTQAETWHRFATQPHASEVEA